MSHLIKNEYKLLYKLFKILIFIFVLTFIYLGFSNYIGNKFVYISFSIISNFLIVFALRKNAIFFETFLSLLLWLGFWFKFTCTITLTDGVFREGVGDFDYSPKSFDDSLIVSQIGILAFILSGIFRENFLFNYPKKIELFDLKKKFLLLDRKKIWLSFIFLFLIIGVINFYFKIYQKGLLPIYDIHFIISGTFKWLLLFGLSAISSILIFYEVNFFKKFFLSSSLIIFFETFFTSLNLLSRGMIFNALALFFGIYKFSKKVNKTNSISFYLKSFTFIFILFYISVGSVNYIRANYFYKGKSIDFTIEKHQNTIDKNQEIKKYSSLKQHNSEILYLIINRWVGIDGVMSVVSKKELLGKTFLLSSFQERAKPDSPTFYELTFGLEGIDTTNQQYANVKGNTLPGFIAFIFYSGSYYLLFSFIFIVCIVASYFEYISFKYSHKNLIFSALIGQVIAFRLIHFGYLPHQSYLLFGTIILTMIMAYILSFFLIKK
jgi:hypothetical protein